MLNKYVSHIKKYRHFYVWIPLIALVPIVLGHVAQYLNHGKPLEADPSSIYGLALETVPVIVALILTSMYSGFLNSSLTREEYVVANWQTKLVENIVELIVFIAILTHFHLHS